MIALTTQQRDLIHKLLNADTVVVMADVAHDLGLTPRQVEYRLKPIRVWLAQREVTLKTTPGLGIEILCSPEKRSELLHELETQTDFQLILTPGQRRQFFALCLLTADSPLIINWLKQMALVSKSTILSDLDFIDEWVRGHNLTLIRRPNYGFSLEGTELAQRQALIALLWGDIAFGEPLTKMTYNRGLLFSMTDDVSSLRLVQYANDIFENLDIKTMLDLVASAETKLDGRFTDDVVLHLTLAFAVQQYRIQAGYYVNSNAEMLHWLQENGIWSVATDIFQNIGNDLSPDNLLAEAAYVAMHLLAGTRHHVWPGDLYVDPSLTDLITVLMKNVAQAFDVSKLGYDPSLRDGLFAHIIPAIMRQRFGLWAPSTWSDGQLSQKYIREYNIARELSIIITEQTDIILPDGEIDTLTLLLRAAFIRERPHHAKRVFIVCPSGVATSQLLMARLKPQFPSLEIIGILSLRELTSERVAGAHFLISTVPIEDLGSNLPVIQVDPLLFPEDVEAITNYLLGLKIEN
ncbi:MAG: transcription antiterminator [Chloroflexota bacterium]